MIKIAPSILASDFSRMGDNVKEMEHAGADWIHIDVMDGQFVPPITFGHQMVEAIRPLTSLPLDVHLMVQAPENQIDFFAKAGADCISVHVEATNHLHKTIHSIKQAGLKAGVVLNPGTYADVIIPVIQDVDFVLQMTVNPGFGGQSFIPTTLTNIKRLRALIDEYKLPVDIQVDGGINVETAKACVDAGATILVAGSSIFQADHYEKAIAEIRG
ncbi:MULTISPECIES: ribulose-phosphate 3-epimerase [Bacillaceae]|uniref:Ribulose-phosphate 3-epimerase n=2 Tax=Bacillaceae TaxID=186817 RepID=A0A9D5I2V3_9BACI|nr:MULTISPECIES: ribulose-phosphate 3-epimerase [Bacillaceae]KQL58194.1 ribulose phosphate epimerase [Alkalicoccobacillus plakortidis]MBG9784270.1 ribulose-phosphate 3-epimerase [Shouchella lehensis]RQW20718.1 ribulose-phosphate 3-epimerase [Bacillus sp. C1-1]TES50740.1 ribulose-phosphate 3-epimerase [Shouchella lehensis]